MAFTIAHMAAALPFYKSNSKSHSWRWIQFDALLIGTMIPDLHYFLRIGESLSNKSHEWIGLFTYCLPWGLLIFALWYWLLKPATFALIQPFFKEPLTNTSELFYVKNDSYDKLHFNVTYHSKNTGLIIFFKKRFICWLDLFLIPVIFGLILGAATHLIWDGITHADGFIARHIDWLQYRLYIYPFQGTTISRLLQYLSSIVGLIVLFRFVLSYLKTEQYVNKRLVNQPVKSSELKNKSLTKNHSFIIMSSIIIISLLLSMKAFIKYYPKLTSSPYTFAAQVSVSLIQNIGIMFIFYSIIYYLARYTYLYRKKKYQIYSDK